MKKVLWMMLVIGAIASSCKKYEYNQTLKKIYGTYTVTNYTVDGVDSLSLFKDSLSTNFEFSYNESQNLYVLKIEGNTSLGKHILIMNNWGLMGDDKTLNLHNGYNSKSGTGPFGGTKESTWTIIDLSKNNLIMKSTYNDKQYNIELRK